MPDERADALNLIEWNPDGRDSLSIVFILLPVMSNMVMDTLLSNGRSKSMDVSGLKGFG